MNETSHKLADNRHKIVCTVFFFFLFFNQKNHAFMKKKIRMLYTFESFSVLQNKISLNHLYSFSFIKREEKIVKEECKIFLFKHCLHTHLWRSVWPSFFLLKSLGAQKKKKDTGLEQCYQFQKNSATFSKSAFFFFIIHKQFSLPTNKYMIHTMPQKGRKKSRATNEQHQQKTETNKNKIKIKQQCDCLKLKSHYTDQGHNDL